MLSTVRCRGSVRAPGPGDTPALIAMFERCSPESRYARFLSPVPTFPARHLDDVVHPRPGRWSWVVADHDADSSRIVAVASLFRSETACATAELGLLVEDDEQRHGLGTELLGIVAARAMETGISTLVAVTLADADHVRRMLELCGTVSASSSGPTSELRVDLPTL